MTKTFTVLRGFTGDGKTTAAKKLDNGRGFEIAADYYPGLYVDGIYQPELQKASHGWCISKVCEWMQDGIEEIIVHNTFLEIKYINNYIALASSYGYTTHILNSEAVILPNGDRTKSEHNVPEDVVKSMSKRFQPFNSPPKCGITLSEIAQEMQNIRRPDAIVFDMDFTIKRPLADTFPTSPDDFRLMPEFELWLAKQAPQRKDLSIYVVTNQKGVMFSHKTIDFLQEEIENLVACSNDLFIDRVYAAISDDEVLTYSPLNKKWSGKCKSLFGRNSNMAEIAKPGTFTFADIHQQNEECKKFWIVGDSHTDKYSTDWDYAINCKHEFPELQISYVPIEMLNLCWDLVNTNN